MDRRKFFQNSLAGLAGLPGLTVPPWTLAEVEATGPANPGLKAHWPTQSPQLFHSALEEGLGFSFMYAGQKVGPGLPEGWEISTSKLESSLVTKLRHPSGLLVTCEAKAFPDFESVEYTVRFKNNSSSTLPTLGPILAMDLRFKSEEVLNGLSVVTSTGGAVGGGGLDMSTYPPPDYVLRRRSLAPMIPGYGAIILNAVGGRSSQLELPFWFVENEAKGTGIFVAFGWSGQWKGTVTSEFPIPVLSITGMVPEISLRLQSGEEISGPRILVGCYEGPFSSGSNRFRQLLRTQYTPSLGGEKPQPICVYDHWWNIGGSFDEKLLRELTDAATDLGQEAFLVDAEWSITTPDSEYGGYDFGVGNWVPNKTKFPSGMRAFADYVRSKGLKFGLWFEPERVVRHSLLAREHPDWCIWLPGKYDGLVNLALPEAEQWVKDLLDRFIGELDVQYLRYDFNIAPLAYWATQDPSGRKGITQIRHIEAFYRIIDWVRNHHPETEMEGCASGGRRIDLETVRRFHTFWPSDHTADPHIIRYHAHGLNHFLTGNYLYSCFILPLPGQKNFTPPDIAFQNFFGGELGTGGRIDKWPQAMKEQARRHIAVHKKIRKYLQGDYYALTRQPLDMMSWEAWQFHDPKTGEGFVQAFRLNAEQAAQSFTLKGLKPDVNYRLSDPYSKESRDLEGSKLLKEGIRFDLGPLSSQVWVYQELPRCRVHSMGGHTGEQQKENYRDALISHTRAFRLKDKMSSF
jgi:alpha-galactosidase